MGNFVVSSEDQSANRKADRKECAHRVPDGNKDSTGITLANHLLTLPSRPETSWEAELTCDRLIRLTEEISR